MIGDKIRQKRLELGLTQEELALRVGYKDKTAINKIETNRNGVKSDLLVRISNALGCEPTELLVEIDHEHHSSDAIRHYAFLLSKLSPAARDNAIQYIKYLSESEKKGGQNEPN